MHISALHKNSDYAFLFLRLIIAAIFLVHGYQKWALWSTAPAMPETLLTIMRFLSIAEPIAGIALIIGLFTQIAAIGLCVVMVSAIYTKINVFGSGFSGNGGWEFDLVILAATLVLVFHGAGKFSLDAAVQNKKIV